MRRRLRLCSLLAGVALGAVAVAPAGAQSGSPNARQSVRGAQDADTFTWCVGDDVIVDGVGDPGPDLLGAVSTRACTAGDGFLISVYTARPDAIVELRLDTDLDLATGCDGYDESIFVGTGSGFPVGSSARFLTPTCDDFAEAPGGYEVLEHGDSTHAASSPHGFFDGYITAVLVHSEVELAWYPVVFDHDVAHVDATDAVLFNFDETVACAHGPTADPVASDGYWLATADGQVYEFGSAPDRGDACRNAFGLQGVVDLAPWFLPDGGPSWVALHLDGVWTFGDDFIEPDPRPMESGGLRPADPAVAIMAAEDRPTGPGAAYWVVHASGTVVPVGHGVTFGDAASIGLKAPIIDAVPTPTYEGYWLIASDGGVFAFGDAGFHGSTGNLILNEPVVGMAPDPDGKGYWLVAADGGVFAYDAPFRGSVPGVLAPGVTLNDPVAAMVSYGDGYLLLAEDGGVFDFSDRDFGGSLGSSPPEFPVVAVLPLPAP